MAKQRLLFIFSLILGIQVYSQEAADTVQAPPRFVQPSIYIDYGKLLTIPSAFETKYEGGLELNFYDKFPLIIEIGQATLTPEGAYSNGTYESEGIYYRVGFGYINQFLPKNKIGFSFRYASSTFNENGRIFIESPSGAQETFVQNIRRENLSATWYEMVVYSDRRLTDLFSIGLNLRLKVLADYDEQDPVDVYAIPGYGRSFENTVPAMNFFLKVTF
ncbi:DUF6048 family protein [Ekhidna sp.]